ncbi:MAG: glycine cleavage system aminomethyltransferase GcvT [Candidatus Thermoplasmatota archaeon]
MPKKSPLNDLHKELGASFTEFAGFEMPLQYTSIKDEHLNVRKKVGVFDVSHMSNLWIKGEDAEELLTLTTMEDASRIGEGKSQYAAVLREDGSMIDDTIFMHVDDRFMMIPNAGKDEKVAGWLRDKAEENGLDVDIENVTGDYVILAVQGPKTRDVLQKLTDEKLSDLGFFGCKKINIGDVDCIISYTGYTGELGYEFQITPPEEGKKLYKKILEAGEEYGIKPIGIGARDTLRLEKFFLLSGNEFNGERRTPLEAGIGFFLYWDHEFIGKEALKKQKEKGGYQKLSALECKERGVPRHGCEVQKDGATVGNVTSGTMSPCLKKGIAMAYVNPEYSEIGTTLEIIIRGKPVEAEVVKPPFVKKDWAEKEG